MTFASMEDLELLFRPLSQAERQRAQALLPLVENCLRMEADKVGRDLDVMVEGNPFMMDVARSVVVDVTARALMTATDQPPMTQFSQTAGPFSASGTFLVPGGGLFIKRSELQRLGLRRQSIRAVNIYGTD